MEKRCTRHIIAPRRSTGDDRLSAERNDERRCFETKRKVELGMTSPETTDSKGGGDTELGP